MTQNEAQLSSYEESPPSTSRTRYVLQDFEGPLDLLLFLIKKNEINIYDIPIASVTEQYLAFISTHEKVGLEDLTEFYSMAATLLYIKSRMLLPIKVNLDDELDDPRRELVEKLIEYQKFKKLTELMVSSIGEEEFSIEREKKQAALPFEEEDLWEEIEVWELLNAFSRIMRGLSAERIIDLYEEVSVNEKISLIYELIESRGEFAFTDLIIDPRSIMEVVCAFLAVLETTKARRIRIYQHKMFGDIRLQVRPEADIEARDQELEPGNPEV